MISALFAYFVGTNLWKKWLLFLIGPIFLFVAHFLRLLIVVVGSEGGVAKNYFWMFNDPGDLLLIVFAVLGLLVTARMLSGRTRSL